MTEEGKIIPSAKSEEYQASVYNAMCRDIRTPRDGRHRRLPNTRAFKLFNLRLGVFEGS